jgi:hypothetical protein
MSQCSRITGNTCVPIAMIVWPFVLPFVLLHRCECKLNEVHKINSLCMIFGSSERKAGEDSNLIREPLKEAS